MIYLKLLSVITLMFSFLIRSTKGFLIDDDFERLEFYSENTSHYSKRLLKVLNIKVQNHNLSLSSNKIEENGLFVSNHLSWLDILILSAYHPMLFITSKEIEKTFFLGFMAKAGGSFFVNRRNMSDLFLELKTISEALLQGHNLMLFPEATSSNGEMVLNLKSTFIESCRTSNKPIYPLCINYKEIDGEVLSAENRDRLFWYGTMSFLPSFIKVLQCRKIVVKLSIFDKINPEIHQDRKVIKDILQNLLNKEYKRIS